MFLPVVHKMLPAGCTHPPTFHKELRLKTYSIASETHSRKVLLSVIEQRFFWQKGSGLLAWPRRWRATHGKQNLMSRSLSDRVSLRFAYVWVPLICVSLRCQLHSDKACRLLYLNRRVRARGAATPVHDERVNWYVLDHLLYEGVERQKKSSNPLGNALSDALTNDTRLLKTFMHERLAVSQSVDGIFLQNSPMSSGEKPCVFLKKPRAEAFRQRAYIFRNVFHNWKPYVIRNRANVYLIGKSFFLVVMPPHC